MSEQPKWPSAPEDRGDRGAIQAFLSTAFARLHPSAECTIAERAWLTGQLLGLCMSLSDGPPAPQVRRAALEDAARILDAEGAEWGGGDKQALCHALAAKIRGLIR